MIEEENGGSSGGSATTASASETKLDITNYANLSIKRADPMGSRTM